MKTRFFTILLAFIGFAPFSFSRAQDINLTGYTLTFDDEFNTLSVTTNNPKGSATWLSGPANGGTGYFSESNWNINALSVSNGVLTDSAYYSGGWQSGEITSIDSSLHGFSQQYGYFEIRAQMPNAGTGAWPAFWLDTTSAVTGGQNEEVDIFEWYGVCNTPGSPQAFMQQACHSWNTDGSQGPETIGWPQTPMPGGAYPWQGFHTYGCQIDPVHITWYIDGVQSNQTATPTAYLTAPFYMMVDYALGGGWPLSGAPLATDGTSSLLVDWVRVYALPGSGGGAPTTYALSVTNGTGSGNYTAGQTVTVTANAAPSGQQFAGWTGATGALASPSSATTTLTMPAAATAITATYSTTSSGGGGGGSSGTTLIANGTYEIVNQTSGLALTSAGTGNGSAITQQSYTGSATQQWTVTNLGNNVVEIVASGSSAALEVPGASDLLAVDLDVSGYTGATNQQWNIISVGGGYYDISNVNSNYEAYVENGSAGDVVFTEFTGPYPTGEWAFTPVTAGSGGSGGGSTPTTYALTVNSGTGGGSYAAGTSVTVTANAAPSGQQFAGWTGATGALASPSSASTTLTMPSAATAITATYSAISSSSYLIPNGTYEIVNQTSGLALTAGAVTNGSGITQQSYSGSATQQWTVTNLGNNVVEIVPSGSSEALEVPGASDLLAIDLDISSYTAGANQKWNIISVGGGYYDISNVNSNYEAYVENGSAGDVVYTEFTGPYPNGEWAFTPVTGGGGGGTTTYALTVTNGTGGGSYAAGTSVTVTANAAPSGQQFAGWTGATSALASPSSATTTLTMPAAATAITATYTATSSPSGGTLIPNGTYKIVNQTSGLALAAGGTANGSSVTQQTYTSAATQVWTVTNLGNNVVEILASGTSEALEVPGASNLLGIYLDISSYTGATNQKWNIISTGGGYYDISNVNSNYEAYVANSSAGDGVFTEFTGPYPNGEWAFTAASGGTSGSTTYALTVNNGSGGGTYAAGTTVTVTANAPPSGQQFAGWTGANGALANPASATTTLTMPAAATAITATYTAISGGNVFVPNGTYEIVNQTSGLALTAAGTGNGSAITQEAYTSAATQKWTVTNLGNNVVEIVPSGSSAALEVPGASDLLGIYLDISSYTGATSQQWNLVSVGGGYYDISNVNSNYEAYVANGTAGDGVFTEYTGPYPNGFWSFTPAK